jgi:hypothetical protein
MNVNPKLHRKPCQNPKVFTSKIYFLNSSKTHNQNQTYFNQIETNRKRNHQNHAKKKKSKFQNANLKKPTVYAI